MYPNTEAIYREFTFLSKHYKRKDVKSAKVSRVNEKLLSQRSHGDLERRFTYSFPFTYENEKIILFDQAGKALGRVGKNWDLRMILYLILCLVSLSIWVWIFPPPYWGESVGQALVRCGKKAYYVTWLKDDNELIVYKPPQGFTILGWYEEQIRRSRESVREALKEIDSEARTDQGIPHLID
jgi:hypothetical protein